VRHGLRSGLVALGLALAIVALIHAGRGPMAAPGGISPASLRAWLSARGPDVAFFAGLRLVALGLAWYLLFVTLLNLGAHATGSLAVIRAADFVTLPSVRRVLSGAVGLSLTASTMALAGPAYSAGSRPPAATAAADELPLIRHLPADAGNPAPTMRWLPAPTPAPAAAPGVPVAAQVTDTTWVVQPGDSFWSRAEYAVASRLGQTPDDAEVDAYWVELIEANRARLVHRDEPSLIYPGQIFVMPPPR